MIAELYTVYRTELLKYCCMICGNVSDAEDLLQETFMKALSNLDLLEELGEKERRAWLYICLMGSFLVFRTAGREPTGISEDLTQ